MSIIINDQIASYLIQYGVSHAMIKILQEQRINDEDLQTIDRDDIDHLFKNENGFTFRDRKQIWSAIQNFQLANANNEVVCTEGDETPDIYEIIDNEPANYSTTQQYTSLSSSNTYITGRTYNHSFTSAQKNILEESSSSNNDDAIIIARSSAPDYDQISEHCPSKKSVEYLFKYPVELPTFSYKVQRAFDLHTIESEWRTLINELCDWILTKKQTYLKKGEFQAIGQTLYKIYPVIAKDGFRPWSHLCRCLTQAVRKERIRRGLPCTR